MQTSFKNNKKKSRKQWVILHSEKTPPYGFYIEKPACPAGVFSAAAFAGNTFGQFLNQWRFQFYLLSLLVMFYALFNRFFSILFGAAAFAA